MTTFEGYVFYLNIAKWFAYFRIAEGAHSLTELGTTHGPFANPCVGTRVLEGLVIWIAGPSVGHWKETGAVLLPFVLVLPIH